MRNYTKLVQVLIGAGLVVGMNGAMAKLWQNEEMTNEVIPDGNYNYVVEGNAWLNSHTYFSHNPSVVKIGGNLNRVGDLGVAKLELQDHTTVSVDGNVSLDTLANNGLMKIGGTLTVDVLVQKGTLTGLEGAALGKVVVREFYNSAHGTYDDLTVTGRLNNDSANLTMSGTVGTSDAAANVGTNSGNIVVNGNVYAKSVSMTSGNVTVNGTLETFGGWAMLTGSGSDVLSADKVVVRGGGTIDGAELKANTLEIVAVEGNAVEGKSDLFTVANEYSKGLGKLNVGTLSLQGNVNFQHRGLKDNYLEIERVILNTTSANHFQTYGGMKLGTVEVTGDARIDGYVKAEAEADYWDIPIEIGSVNVGEEASLTFSNTIGTGQSKATIGTAVLKDGAALQNAAYKPDGTTLRKGYQLSIGNLDAENATISTIDGSTTLGSDNGVVTLSGTVNDSGDGRTILNLNSADARWTATGESRFDTLHVNGGTTDISQTTESVAVSTLSGTGTIVMDAAGNNKLVAVHSEDAKFVAKASMTADDVSVSEAAGMLDRLVGVTDKSGLVDEGMYNGAIVVDSAGHATQAKNTLMNNTMELTAASTLSLNRILMNDVRKRLGNIRSADAAYGVWARYDGGKLDGEGTTNKFNTIHVGGDMAPFADSAWRLGVSASYTTGDVDYTRGTADLDAYSLAAYATWMGESGLFADVIARVAKSESDMTVDGVYKGELDNTAYSLSGELGMRFDFSEMFYAEPQMEATYTNIDSGDLSLLGRGEAYRYSVDSFDSFIGRVGFLAGMKCPNQKGEVYVRLSLAHEFLGDATITGGNSARQEHDGEDTWLEYGIGANINLTKSTYVWLDLERTADAMIEEDWRGTVGVRYSF